MHTAGLLHDIGKFAFPDRILLAPNRISEADSQIVRQHPEQGARLVRAVQGYEEIADLILAHHERIDGLGYPRGLAGEEIPLLARMISVADVYDVITARDTYRVPVGRGRGRWPSCVARRARSWTRVWWRSSPRSSIARTRVSPIPRTPTSRSSWPSSSGLASSPNPGRSRR